ncbi:amidohydrolase family protein [Salipiger sp. P9]|uniref:amidohydrolase family protein n=1 Tax=Salipiger pentaromativorans TaxID=2943193 RepID=UPI002157B95D|nr:amidohydrolase family protein [Salipiger pentaromativorans]MCR8550532.1 amidohydrolase family protein [Salipiger pentaromativorans]
MAFDTILAHVRLPGHEGLVDLGFRAGKIAAIAPDLPGGAPRWEAGGALAFPGFADSHVHLDKACILDRCAICEGTLSEAIAQTAAAKAGFTAEDVYARAKTVLEKAILHGTNRMRSFVEVDPRAGTRSFEALTALRKDYAYAVDLDICAFAQEGLTQEMATYDMLDACLGQGAQMVGGCPYADPDPERHIALIFDLAEKHGTDVDFHLDFDLDPTGSTIPAVLRETEARGYGGRVSIGHVSKLSAMAPEEVSRIARRLADAGVALTVLPATDLFLMGRGRDRLVPRGMAPAQVLREEGVVTSIATNNVLNPFTPYGDASLARMANLFANVAQLSCDSDLAAAFAMVTEEAARLMRVPDYAIAVGGAADVVLIDAPDAASAVRGVAPVLAGWKAGKQTFERPRARLIGR